MPQSSRISGPRAFSSQRPWNFWTSGFPTTLRLYPMKYHIISTWWVVISCHILNPKQFLLCSESGEGRRALRRRTKPLDPHHRCGSHGPFVDELAAKMVIFHIYGSLRQGNRWTFSQCMWNPKPMSRRESHSTTVCHEKRASDPPARPEFDAGLMLRAESWKGDVRCFFPWKVWCPLSSEISQPAMFDHPRVSTIHCTSQKVSMFFFLPWTSTCHEHERNSFPLFQRLLYNVNPGLINP